MAMTTNDLNGIPVAGTYDIIVVGGGPAGVSAAFAASRRGMKTLIVEQFNCLGGIATAGGHGHICLYSGWGWDPKKAQRIVGGVIWEISKRTADAGYGVANNCASDFEIEGMKYTLDKMAEETKTDVIYYTQFADAIVENGNVIGIVVQNKSGRQAYYAKRIIDCTGDGDVAARAGCGYDLGDEETGHCQPMTLMFTIGGVAMDKVREFKKTLPAGDNDLKSVWKKAQDNGDMRPFQSKIMGWWWTPTRPDQVGVNFTHINFVDATNAGDLTKATIEGRKQAYETIEVYRKYIPGMENCYMVSTPNTVGTRESRRIHGHYTLTKDDIKNQRSFDDSIGYGSFFIDIHGTKGAGMDEKTWYPPAGFKYQIPYGIIVPKDAGNLFVAGRCASTTHEALGSLRVMPQCGIMGEAAATAAAISIQKNVQPKDVNTRELQAMLKEQRCIIDESDIGN
ncbi:MAG: FAD-dependent oxidoreductase [Spirochaetes bacterium]|nr:FAD-dependent oxidoreductase [Spirochaetota bacterium]